MAEPPEAACPHLSVVLVMAAHLLTSSPSNSPLPGRHSNHTLLVSPLPYTGLLVPGTPLPDTSTHAVSSIGLVLTFTEK